MAVKIILYGCNLPELHLIGDIPIIQREAIKVAYIPHLMYTTNKKKIKLIILAVLTVKALVLNSYLSPLCL